MHAMILFEVEAEAADSLSHISAARTTFSCMFLNAKKPGECKGKVSAS
jgi:hypothetical protein